MSTKTEPAHVCAACGATIYPEMIDSGLAERIAGQLVCPHCAHERRRKAEAAASSERPLAFDDGGLEDASEGSASGAEAHPGGTSSDRIQYTSGPPRGAERKSYQRALGTGVGHATRCRTFHCKLSDAAFAHLDDQINDWADQHQDVEIKFATTSIGTIEGKHADPHLIVNVFY